MADMIITNRPDHVSSAEAYADVRTVITQMFDQAREITDAVALTIASWWQSPGRDGMPFASLSTTGSVETTALLDAIHVAYNEAVTQCDVDSLNCLGTWAINHPSRKHVSYPHEHGYLFDCPACEAQCYCAPGNATCVFSGPHS